MKGESTMKRAVCLLLTAMLLFGTVPLSFAEGTEGIVLAEDAAPTLPELPLTPRPEEDDGPADDYSAPDDYSVSDDYSAADEDPAADGEGPESLYLSDNEAFWSEEAPVPAYQDYSFDYGITGGRYTSGFSYSDSFFLGGSTVMSPELAKISIGLAALAYVDVGSTPTDLYATLRNMGFEPYTGIGNYDRVHTVSDNDFVRYTIAAKPIKDGESNTIVYLVIVQGTRGGYDWNSNFNIGDGEDHAGFYLSRAEIMSNLCSLMEQDGADRRIVLTTGHSRGAAVSNIVAGELTDGSSGAVPGKNLAALVAPGDVHSYNFACPAVSRRAAVRNTDYRNIFNFNSSDDIIPILPMADWGYVRYGIDNPRVFDCSSPNFLQRFKNEAKVDYTGTPETTIYLSDILNDWIPNASATNGVGCQALFRGVAFMMRDGNTLKDFLESVGFFAGENLLTVLQSYAGQKIGFDEVTAFFDKADALVLRASSCLRDTEGMSDQEFTAWLAENRERVEYLENETGYNIQRRKDLTDIYNLALADSIAEVAHFDNFDAAKAENLLESAMELWIYFKGAGRLTSIRDAHQSLSYVLAINSMFYGYRGWYNYPTSFGVRLSAEDGVAAIGESCFVGSNITNVQADDQLRHVGKRAFSGCSTLQAAELGYGLKNIGLYAFYNCSSLKSLYIPDSVETLGVDGYNGPFVGCHGMKELSVGGVQEITCGMLKLNSTALEKLTIRGSVKSIGADALNSEGGSGNVLDDNGYKYLVSTSSQATLLVIEEGVERIGARAFRSCSIFTSVSLPSTIKEIGEDAFSSCYRMTGALELPQVERIGAGAFYNSKLNSVSFGNRLESIGQSAFSECSSLRSVSLGESVKSIGAYAFYNCSSLKSLYIPDSVETLGVDGYNGPFVGCHGMKELSVGGVQEITCGMLKLNSTALEKLTIRGSVKSIGADALNSEGGSGNVLDDNGYKYLVSTSSQATLLVIEEGVERIGARAFRSCSIFTSVSLPSTIKEIGEDAFSSCYRMTGALELPQVERIGAGAFRSCSRLGSAVIPASATSIGTGAFQGCSSAFVIYGYADSIAQEAARIDGVRFVPLNSTVPELIVPAMLETIGAEAFSGGSFGRIRLSERTNSIEDRAFADCEALYVIFIPNADAVIADNAFEGCRILSIRAPAGGAVQDYASRHGIPFVAMQ